MEGRVESIRVVSLMTGLKIEGTVICRVFNHRDHCSSLFGSSTLHNSAHYRDNVPSCGLLNGTVGCHFALHPVWETPYTCILVLTKWAYIYALVTSDYKMHI